MLNREKIELEVEKRLSAEGVRLKHLKELKDLATSVHGFVEYLGQNQYYSESVNKRVVLLNLDADALLLELEETNLLSCKAADDVENLVVAGKKGCLGKERASGLRKRMEEAEANALELKAKALALIKEIRDEYQRKA